MTFREALAAGRLLLDGATGSELIARGCPLDRPPAVWTFERPDEVARLAREYVDAGARVVLANTFCGSPSFVEHFGFDSTLLVERAIAIAREAAGERAFVAASLSTVWIGDVERSRREAEYRQLSEKFVANGVDAIVIETITSIDDLRLAVGSANASRGRTPLVACMSFNADGRTADGTFPEEMAWVLEDLGADAVGVNCCDGPETALHVVEALARATDLPIWAKPNAGLPGGTVTDGEFADVAIRIVGAGASAIGGCCGTTPRTIRAVAAMLGRLDPGL